MRPPATACAALLALVLSACGGPSDEEQVRDTVARFGKATAKKDYKTLCDDVLSKQLVRQVRSIGLPCEDALAKGLGAVRSPKLRIDRVKIRDEVALVEVTTGAAGQAGSRDVLRLVPEDGGWRVAALSGSQPPAPPRAP